MMQRSVFAQEEEQVGTQSGPTSRPVPEENGEENLTRGEREAAAASGRYEAGDGTTEREDGPTSAAEVDAIAQLKERLVDLRHRVTYDAMAVLFRRYELAKPSTQILFDKRWLTAFVSEPIWMYKVVATTLSGKLLSIYDGKTEYRLGRRQRARRGAASWPPITCCFFCYPSVHQAIAASLPSSSKLRGQPRVILKLRCEGRAYVHNNRHVTSGGRNVDAYERGDHEPVSVVVNGNTEYRSDDFDVWAFSDVVPITMFHDIVQEEGLGAHEHSAPLDKKRMAFRV